MMACDSGNHRTQVFDLNGKFVGKFETTGSNSGEFKSPESLAVVSNGRIVVCDRVKNHIELLQ